MFNNFIFSLFFLFFSSICGQQNSEDVCLAFNCGRFQDGMCRFSQPGGAAGAEGAGPGGAGDWEWAQSDPEFNVNLGIWKDAESTVLVFPGRSTKLLPRMFSNQFRSDFQDFKF